MELSLFETVLHWAGGIFALGVLGILLFGIWRGTRRPADRTSGMKTRWLRSAVFYLAATIVFLAVSILFWKPLPLALSPQLRLTCALLGALLYFPGLALLLWGRLTLGRMYFVSTSFSAQLFAGHKLITHGIYAFLRHPMYTGLVAAGVGTLLLYFTWTTLAFAVFAPFVLLRARREEAVLSAEFGEQWKDYASRVPPFLPRLKKRGSESTNPRGD